MFLTSRFTLRLIVGFILALFVVDSWALPVHKFTQYTKEDGLDELAVQDILQDKQGLLWFGTWNGLYSFDGYRFRRHVDQYGETEFASSRFRYLSEHPDGSLWMISYDGILYRYNPYSGRFSRISPEGHFVDGYRIMSDGIVWIVTDQQHLLIVRSSGSADQFEVSDLFSVHKQRIPSRINHLGFDTNGIHWIQTEEGTYCYDPVRNQLSQITRQSSYEWLSIADRCYFGGRKGRLYYTPLDQTSSVDSIQFDTKSSIKLVRKLSDDQLLLTTGKDGFFLYTPSTGTSQHVNTRVCPALGDDTIREVFADSYGDLWFRTSQPGVVHYVPASGSCRRHIMVDDDGMPIVGSLNEQMIVEDCNHNLWVHPSGGGLAWFNRAQERLESFFNPILFNRWNNASVLLSLFSDHQGNLWICTVANGLEKISFLQQNSTLDFVDSSSLGSSSNNVRGMCQTRDGYIFKASRDQVIRVYNQQQKFVGNLCLDGSIRSDHSDHFGFAYDMIEGRDGTFWIGTKGNGLFSFTPKGNHHYDVQHFLVSPQEQYGLGSNAIYDLHEDHRGRIWIATFENGINILERDPKTSAVRIYNTRNDLSSYPLVQFSRARCVTGDEKGNVYIGTTGGLLCCDEDFSDPQSLRFHAFVHEPGNGSSLSANDVMDICLTSTGRNFVATFGGGFCEFVRQDDGRLSFSRISSPDQKDLGDMVLSMLEDRNRDLWMVGEDAICRYGLESKQFKIYTSQLLPFRLSFNEGKPLLLQSGEMLCAAYQGVYTFNPDSIKENTFVPPIIFMNDSILLQPGQHSFVSEFSALDYSFPEFILYAYRLKGFEQDWHYVGSQHQATYTNLSPGKYTLEVRSTNSSREWVENTNSIAVEVLPFFIESTVGRILSYLGLLAFLAIILVVVQMIFKLHHKVRVEEQLADLKLKFFTNLSHELRTPLTLISGPIEQIRKRKDVPVAVAGQLDIVSANVTRMLRLVTQMLDFRKIEKGKMHLIVQPIDLVSFIESHVRNFTLLAESMKIPLHFDTELSRLDLWADVDKLDQIINNLLGNAFKYSSADHPIHVSVAEADGFAVLEVDDNGVGIAQERLLSIFDRFGKTPSTIPSGMPSSGLGLSLAREFVLLHGGDINLKSQLGVGTKVTVKLPLGRSHFPAETEFVSGDAPSRDSVIIQEESDAPVPVVATPLPSDSEDNPELSVLVVEDNQELRAFIRQIFEPNYVVYEAADGREGLRVAEAQMPDLVVSDVLMPLMDGFQLSRSIRQHPQLCHIPIILLTALGDTDHKLKGLDLGIDSYITKPFSASYLLARVDNILQNRRMLQTYYLQQLSSGLLRTDNSASSVAVENLPQAPMNADMQFISQVIADMKQNLGNADYSVDQMASAANMSRSTFGRKVRALMGKVPSDLLRDLRLQQAAQLIDNGDMNISQVAYEVGFSDPHYFGKCFKTYFQMTPTEYKSRNNVSH